MENEFVDYETALALKEIGFNEPCCARYYYEVEDNKLRVFQPNYARDFNSVTINLTGQKNNDKPLFISVPTFSQAFRWLLKEHKLYAVIIPTLTMCWTFKTMTVVEGMVEVPPYNHVDAYDYVTRDEAELECLKKLIEIVKKK